MLNFPNPYLHLQMEVGTERSVFLSAPLSVISCYFNFHVIVVVSLASETHSLDILLGLVILS